MYFYDTGTGAIAHRIKTNQKCVVLANPVPQSQAIAFTGLEDVSIFIWDVRLSLQRGIEREAKNKLVLFEKPDSGYAYVSVTWPGMLGVVSGMNTQGLAVSGLQMQTVFHNPLAGPSVLGVSNGASLGVSR